MFDIFKTHLQVYKKDVCRKDLVVKVTLNSEGSFYDQMSLDYVMEPKTKLFHSLRV